jgi:sec-independent protein translocase protein TatC
MVGYKERSFVEYIGDLRLRVTRIAILVGIVTVFCMTFSISIFNFNGYKIPFPRPDTFNNIAIQVMLTMKVNLLPQNVNLIQLTPQGPFFSQIYVSASLGIMLVMPVIVKELIGFISPGLYLHERAIVKKFTASAVGLFATGCLFSYFMVIPYILSFLYKYGQAIGVSTFFDIGEFIPFVMQSMIISGLSYQLPIVMWAITASGIAEYTFWRRSLRYAVITFALFGAVVTPDGSGVTMWFVAGPMLLLYVLGMLIIETKNKEVSERH